jgi:hypothetical protein
MLKPYETKPIVKYFAMSTNADRAMTSIGEFKKDVWVEIPYHVYRELQRAIAEGKKYGDDIGWRVKTA